MEEPRNIFEFILSCIRDVLILWFGLLFSFIPLLVLEFRSGLHIEFAKSFFAKRIYGLSNKDELTKLQSVIIIAFATGYGFWILSLIAVLKSIFSAESWNIYFICYTILFPFIFFAYCFSIFFKYRRKKSEGDDFSSL